MFIEEITATRVSCGDGVVFETAKSTQRVRVEAAYAAGLYSVGRKVEAIKHIREVFGCGLKAAKYFCEHADRAATAAARTGEKLGGGAWL